MTTSPLEISFLIPVRGVGTDLHGTVASVRTALLPQFEGRFEIILIPNGGTTAELAPTIECAKKIRSHFSEVKICPSPAMAGKGAALQAGVRIARGQALFYTDADLPYDLKFVAQAYELLQSGYDFITGSRRLPQSEFTLLGSVLPLAYGRHRLGLLFNSVVRLLFPITSRDTQAGIKAMSRAFADEAFARVTCPGFFFDIELFLVAQQNGFRKAELPVHLFLKTEKSTVRLARDGWLSLRWLLQIFRQNRAGHYSRLTPVLSRFSQGLGFKQKLFLHLRYKMTPYESIARFIPRDGRVLDLGCGHGLFTQVMGALRPQCELYGLDHDAARIKIADKANPEPARIHFQVGNLQTWNGDVKNPYQAITLIDTLHYFPPQDQLRLLDKIYTSLEEGGVFLMREVDATEGMRSRLNRFYEKVVTTIGFTRSAHAESTFRKPIEWARLLEKMGFTVSYSRVSHLLFSDVLFIARKSGVHLPTFTRQLQYRSILTTDDWGMSPAVNRGILNLASRNLIDRVSILVDAPFVNEGLSELLEYTGVQVGLHFNLTYQSLFRSPGEVLRKSLNPLSSKSAFQGSVRFEFRRQLDKLLKLTGRVDHVDGHHHVHIFPRVLEAILPLAQEKNITSMRLPLDTALWFSKKFPLVFLALRAKPLLDRGGMNYLPCFYPPLNLFKNPDRLWEQLQEKPGHEVILHPAESDDFATFGIVDSYRAQRVIEYHALLSAGDPIHREVPVENLLGAQA